MSPRRVVAHLGRWAVVDTGAAWRLCRITAFGGLTASAQAKTRAALLAHIEQLIPAGSISPAALDHVRKLPERYGGLPGSDRTTAKGRAMPASVGVLVNIDDDLRLCDTGRSWTLERRGAGGWGAVAFLSSRSGIVHALQIRGVALTPALRAVLKRLPTEYDGAGDGPPEPRAA